MVEHGVTTVLDPVTAQDYRDGMEPMPDWLRGPQLAHQARTWQSADRRRKDEFFMIQVFQIGRGTIPKSMRRHAQNLMEIIGRGMAWQTRNAPAAEMLDPWELGALCVFGIDPEDHRTWEIPRRMVRPATGRHLRPEHRVQGGDPPAGMPSTASGS
jgi:hypothetical protein